LQPSLCWAVFVGRQINKLIIKDQPQWPINLYWTLKLGLDGQSVESQTFAARRKRSMQHHREDPLNAKENLQRFSQNFKN